jgi:phospholipid/cholesterol/gamma-HCH transport system ATP-binding protein
MIEPGKNSPESEPIIIVDDVSMSFRKDDGSSIDVLQGVSFELRRGETVCILGGSGGGKSTLLKVMIGAHTPTQGDVQMGGQSILGLREREMNAVRRRFGVLFQSAALLNSMTVGENVALPIEAHTKLDPRTIDIMVRVKLEQVGLSDAYDRLPSEISGGMQKRAGLARAIALDPEIVFYDEPSAGLDPIATAVIDELINDMKKKMGMTNIVVTHVMESVRRIADRIIMLDRGRVLLNGTLDDLLGSDDPRIQSFVKGETEQLVGDSTAFDRFVSDLLM